MTVESAKDIFFILEEYSKIGERGALVRFHCLSNPNETEPMEEADILKQMTEKRKSVSAAGFKKARTSILAGNSDESEGQGLPAIKQKRSVKFDRGESVVAVEAYLDNDYPRRRLFGCIFSYVCCCCISIKEGWI